MLSRNYSIKNRKFISYLFRRGVFLKSERPILKFKYNYNQNKVFKYVIVISKKNIRKATNRNLIRRRIKAVIRDRKIHTLPINVAITYLENSVVEYKDIFNSFDVIVHNIHQYKNISE